MMGFQFKILLRANSIPKSGGAKMVIGPLTLQNFRKKDQVEETVSMLNTQRGRPFTIKKRKSPEPQIQNQPENLYFLAQNKDLEDEKNLRCQIFHPYPKNSLE